MLIELAGDDLIAGGLDRGQLFGGHLFGLELVVCARGGLFQDAEGVRDLPRHGFQTDADGEILVAALGLRAPVFIGWDFDLAHGVMFDSVLHFLYLKC